MKGILYYRIKNRTKGETIVNLCGCAALKETFFFILPDKQMSFVSFISLPPVPKKRLREMIRFKIETIYPGNFEEIFFDYIPYKKEKGWHVVLYILKKKAAVSVCGKKKCRGIVLPLQFVTEKLMKTLSSLVIFYPDMTEIWEIREGIPVKLTRLDNGKPFPPHLPSEKSRFIISRSVQERPETATGDRVRHTTFSKAFRSFSLKNAYFSRLGKKRKEILTPLFAVTALILSSALLVQTLAEYSEMKQKTARAHTYTKTVRRKAEEVQAKRKTIQKLENTLNERKKNKPVNVYNILLKLKKTIDHGTVISSFTFTGKNISFSCISKNALETLKKIKKEFGTVRISGITPFRDGTEHYSIKLETKR